MVVLLLAQPGAELVDFVFEDRDVLLELAVTLPDRAQPLAEAVEVLLELTHANGYTVDDLCVTHSLPPPRTELLILGRGRRQGRVRDVALGRREPRVADLPATPNGKTAFERKNRHQSIAEARVG